MCSHPDEAVDTENLRNLPAPFREGNLWCPQHVEPFDAFRGLEGELLTKASAEAPEGANRVQAD